MRFNPIHETELFVRVSRMNQTILKLLEGRTGVVAGPNTLINLAITLGLASISAELDLELPPHLHEIPFTLEPIDSETPTDKE